MYVVVKSFYIMKLALIFWLLSVEICVAAPLPRQNPVTPPPVEIEVFLRPLLSDLFTRNGFSESAGVPPFCLEDSFAPETQEAWFVFALESARNYGAGTSAWFEYPKIAWDGIRKTAVVQGVLSVAAKGRAVQRHPVTLRFEMVRSDDRYVIRSFEQVAPWGNVRVGPGKSKKEN